MEIDKAFATRACAAHEEMGWATSRINANGAAIGHSDGAFGRRCRLTGMQGMSRHDAHKGNASSCIGSGLGLALAVGW